ncbi:hypothetical protein ACLB2K_022703 [Fragaria x ananassa]
MTRYLIPPPPPSASITVMLQSRPTAMPSLHEMLHTLPATQYLAAPRVLCDPPVAQRHVFFFRSSSSFLSLCSLSSPAKPRTAAYTTRARLHQEREEGRRRRGKKKKKQRKGEEERKEEEEEEEGRERKKKREEGRRRRGGKKKKQRRKEEEEEAEL